ncbi:MAG: tetratricopeptide repeat protein [Desulfovibrio sp.]|nr:tetratricopeptide repeat protein [Desulfovibrio sp.]
MTQTTNAFLEDKDIALLLDIANLACHKGMPAEARTIVDGVLAVRPGFAPAVITLAYSHLVVDNFDMALDILAPLLEQSPDDADARVIQGMALLLAGRRDEAEEAFTHIPDNCPQHLLATELARVL